MANLQAGATSNSDTGNFGLFTQDNRVRGGGYLTQFAPTVNDYVGFQFTLGPQGAIWAVRCAYAVAPDAAQFFFELASVPEPDPDRAGVDDQGTLLKSDSLSYVAATGTIDGYAPVFADSQLNNQYVFRLMGADHAPLTMIGPATDPWTGYAEADGGAGVYRLRLKVSGKNGASAGYKVYLTALALVRLDDNGFQ